MVQPGNGWRVQTKQRRMLSGEHGRCHEPKGTVGICRRARQMERAGE